MHPWASSRPRGTHRVGPHRHDVLCFLLGRLLGDDCAEQRHQCTRFHVRHGVSQQGSLHWKDRFLSQHGYCAVKTPTLHQTTSHWLPGPLETIDFRTDRYPSLNVLHDVFDPVEGSGKVQGIPSTQALNVYLNPLALAIWAMDDGCKYGSGFCIATQCFHRPDLGR